MVMGMSLITTSQDDTFKRLDASKTKIHSVSDSQQQSFTHKELKTRERFEFLLFKKRALSRRWRYHVSQSAMKGGPIVSGLFPDTAPRQTRKHIKLKWQKLSRALLSTSLLLLCVSFSLPWLSFFFPPFFPSLSLSLSLSLQGHFTRASRTENESIPANSA